MNASRGTQRFCKVRAPSNDWRAVGLVRGPQALPIQQAPREPRKSRSEYLWFLYAPERRAPHRAAWLCIFTSFDCFFSFLQINNQTQSRKQLKLIKDCPRLSKTIKTIKTQSRTAQDDRKPSKLRQELPRLIVAFVHEYEENRSNCPSAYFNVCEMGSLLHLCPSYRAMFVPFENEAEGWASSVNTPMEKSRIEWIEMPDTLIAMHEIMQPVNKQGRAVDRLFLFNN